MDIYDHRADDALSSRQESPHDFCSESLLPLHSDDPADCWLSLLSEEADFVFEFGKFVHGCDHDGRGFDAVLF